MSRFISYFTYSIQDTSIQSAAYFFGWSIYTSQKNWIPVLLLCSVLTGFWFTAKWPLFS